MSDIQEAISVDEVKEYAVIPQFTNQTDKVAFQEAFKSQSTFFYTKKESMDKALKVMHMKCKKKGISVTFKILVKR